MFINKTPETVFEEFKIQNKNFLITGGAGFIGSHLVDDLVYHGAKNITVYDNFVTGRIKNIEHNKKYLHIVDEDIRNKECITKHIKKADYVFHLASLVNANDSFDREKEYEDVIFNATKTIAIACAYNNKPLVYSSSFAVYGDSCILNQESHRNLFPINPYGKLKYAAEAILLATEGKMARFSNVYGERQNGGVVTKLIDSHLIGFSPLINGNGEQTRDFIYVKDVTTALILMMLSSNTNNTIINVCSGKSISINNLNSIIRVITKSDKTPLYAENKNTEITCSSGSNEKLKGLTNWKSNYDLNLGLSITVDHKKWELGL